MEDMQIITLFLARNEDAIRHTDDTYGRRLYHLADGILRSGQDAEESVSDTYMETWKSIPPQRPTYFYAFLASICRNLSLNRLDWRMAAKRNAEVVSLTQEMEQCIPDRLHGSQTDSLELRQVLESFLDSLPRDSRLIFLRRYLYVETVAEIAVRYGISESKIKTQLHRTRKKLHDYLVKEGIFA